MTLGRRLDIIHAHGSLGPYPEISYGHKPTDRDSLRRAAEGIRIASDRIEDSDDFAAAQLAIHGAYNLIFIGFGYDSTTLQLLMSRVSATKLLRKRILGTLFHLDQSTINRITGFFKNKIEVSTANAYDFIQTILPLH